ncbi:hypothetical protein HMPREF9372_0605 [Sporosarcina newyorkensis 2681]|uniref:Uncharacterized protein n=1 Tax=Sporosarcina newyorkensis 2681 TaxID=1027292 RepID=F9DP75_9BACL|nr:hypothetical protein HMPREF9372_0605 [Sporosarcina newyorkensis 2681]
MTPAGGFIWIQPEFENPLNKKTLAFPLLNSDKQQKRAGSPTLFRKTYSKSCLNRITTLFTMQMM